MDYSNSPRFTWITLEAPEVIELKQVMLDRDCLGAVELFWRVVVPRVRDASQKRGISLDETEEENGRLPG